MMKSSKAVTLGAVFFVTAGCGMAEYELVEDSNEVLNADGEVRRATGSVQFTGCREIIGQVSVSAEAARSRVPAEYAIPGEDTGTVQALIRVAQCDSAKVGDSASSAAVTQVGIPIASPDGTGAVNNYSLSFSTDHSALKNWTRSFGSDAQSDSHITFQETVGSDGSLSVTANAGTVMGANAKLVVQGGGRFPAGAFSANWWEATSQGRVKFTTDIPNIFLSFCGGTLEVGGNGEAARFFGGTSIPLSFCLNNQFDSGVLSGSVSP